MSSEPSDLEVDLGSDIGDSEEDSPTGAAPAPARPRAPPAAATPAAPPPPPPACEAMEVEAAAAEEADEEEKDANADDSVAAASGENADDSAADADFVPLSADEAAARREANVAALVAGTLAVARRPAVPSLLSVAAAAATLRRPFKSPHPDAPARSLDLQKKLSARRTFVPWGANAPFRPAVLAAPRGAGAGAAGGPPAPPPPVELPPGLEPLVLWEPPAGVGGAPVRVDDALTRWLRPHQREGVQFMFDCVAGLRGHEGRGARGLGWLGVAVDK
jgi:DNA repair and recombination RAD54-like protein